MTQRMNTSKMDCGPLDLQRGGEIGALRASSPRRRSRQGTSTVFPSKEQVVGIEEMVVEGGGGISAVALASLYRRSMYYFPIQFARALLHILSRVAHSRPLPSLSKMATKEDQDTLRLLVQYVSRAFYEPKFTIITDQLARNPV